MRITPGIALGAGALAVGTTAGTAYAVRSSDATGPSRLALPAGLGILGGTAAVAGLALRSHAGSALVNALPAAGGAVATGGVLGGVLGVMTSSKSAADTWDPNHHGSYDEPNPGEAWDASDPTGTPHPTKYQARRGDLLPNVVPQTPSTVQMSTEDGKRFLDFATTTGNLGEGPLELLKRPVPGQPIKQVIHNRNGSTRELSTDRDSFEDGPRSNHLAFNDFARYELFHADRNGHPKGEIARSQYKESFLIIDTDHVDPTIDPDGKHRVDRTQGSAEVQGISPGYGDTYGPGLCGQSFDVTDLPDGRYVLRQSMDPGKRFVESNDDDNTRDTLIEIKGDTATIISSKLVAPANL